MLIQIVGLLFMLVGQSLGELVRIDLKDLGFQISGNGLNSRPKQSSSNHKNKTLSEYNVYLNEYYSNQWQQFYLAQAAYNQYYGLYTVYSPYESYGPYVIYDPYKTPGHHGHRGHRHRPKPTQLQKQSYPFLQPLLRRLRQFLPIKVRFVPRKKSKASRRRRKPQLRQLQPYPLQLQKPIKYVAKN